MELGPKVIKIIKTILEDGALSLRSISKIEGVTTSTDRGGKRPLLDLGLIRGFEGSTSFGVLGREGTDVVLYQTLGPRTIDLFRNIGLKVHIGTVGTVEDAIKAWGAGQIPEADDHTDCGHCCC